MEEAEPVRLKPVGLRLHAKPIAGETDWVRLMFPENPLTLLTEMEEVAVAPGVVVTFVGLAVIVKSGPVMFWTRKLTAIEWARLPLVALTVTE